MTAAAGGIRRRGRLNRRSARRVAARRRAHRMAVRACIALDNIRHSFAVVDRATAPAGAGKPRATSVFVSPKPLSLGPSPPLKDKFRTRVAAATSDASLRRANESVHRRCVRYVKALPPSQASDQDLADPQPNSAAGAVAQHAQALQALGLHPTSVSGAAPSAPAARAICDDRMSLPGAAATVDLLGALPPALRARYCTAAPTLWTAGAATAPRTAAPPKPCSLTGGAQWQRFVTRMWRAGMVAFTATVVALCGVFAVDKTDGRLRAITDARPANWCFAEPEHVTLPTPDLLARIRVPPGAVAYVARTDAADFYHSFLTPQWMWPYFGLPPVRTTSLPPEARPVGAGDAVFPVLRTLPMGYSHAVLLAQSAHLHLLDSMPHLFSRCNRIGDPLCTDYALRPGRVLHAVCIDDVLLFGLDAAVVAQVQHAYLVAGRRAGYIYKPEKLVSPTADGAPVLGLHFDGRAATLQLQPRKMHALVAATRAAVAQGQMRAVDFQSLMGHWVWAALPCRPALSVFGAAFALAQRYRRGTVKLWPSVKRELQAAADIAPLLRADLSAPTFGRVMASDASSTGLGVVAMPHLRGAVAPGSTVPGINGAVSSPVPREAVTELVSSRWRWGEHINLLEMRAAHVALRWVLRHPLSDGVRVRLWVDSAVVVGVLRKGRSCSTDLNRLARAVAADLLRANVALDVDWVASAFNPADAPSRA